VIGSESTPDFAQTIVSHAGGSVAILEAEAIAAQFDAGPI
jgi:hypothetical protein